MLPESGNNVWSTISDSITKAAEMYRDTKIARLNADMFRAGATQATSAPSGAPSWSVFNPFPGNWGSNPQAQAAGALQPQPQAMLGGMSPMIIVAVVIVAALALFRR